MNAARILEVAESDIGRAESPPASNHVHDITMPGADYPWCAEWVCTVLLRAGIDCPMLLSARKLVEYWQAHGVAMPPMSAPYLPGDLILTDRYEHGQLVGGHVAIVKLDDGRTLTVIGGNVGNAVRCYVQDRAKVVGAARVVIS